MATTLLDLRTRVRERADLESTNFVTDTMLNAWINESYEELYDRVVAAFADTFFSTQDATLTGGTELLSQLNLAGAFRFMRFLEKNPDTPQRIMVPRWQWGKKNRLDYIAYRMLGSVLQVEPYEYAAGKYRVYYVSNPTALTADGSIIDARIETWRDFIVIATCIKALMREESDVSDLRAELARSIARIEFAAKLRDAANPPRVNDVHYPFDRGQSVAGGGGS